MFFRKSKLIRELNEEIHRLRELLAYVSGQRDSAQQGYEGMKEIAAKAILATQDQHVADGRRLKPKGVLLSAYLPDPDPFSVKHCPECNVSVRSDSWPQECPACRCTFGFQE